VEEAKAGVEVNDEAKGAEEKGTEEIGAVVAKGVEKVEVAKGAVEAQEVEAKGAETVDVEAQFVESIVDVMGVETRLGETGPTACTGAETDVTGNWLALWGAGSGPMLPTEVGAAV